MKKVAGGLRLDLAAFRELEAFAQLGTELDKATQRQLDRGYRMVELLKQPQYQPMHVIDQVMIIYAGTEGFLDDVPVARGAARARRRCLKHFRERAPGDRRRELRPHRSDLTERPRREQHRGTGDPRLQDAARQGGRSEAAARSPPTGEPTDGQPASPRQTPQGGAQHPQDHADDGADRHRPVQEGVGPRRGEPRRTPRRSPSWWPTSSRAAGEVDHPLLRDARARSTASAAGRAHQQPRPVRRLQRQRPARGDRARSTSSAARRSTADVHMVGKKRDRLLPVPAAAGRRADLHAVRGQAALRRGRADRQPLHRPLHRAARSTRSTWPTRSSSPPASSAPVVETLLPLGSPADARRQQAAARSRRSRSSTSSCPTPQSILEEMVPATFKVRLFKCFLDAAVSEQIARMVAMKAATENADDMIKALTRRVQPRPPGADHQRARWTSCGGAERADH